MLLAAARTSATVDEMLAAPPARVQELTRSVGPQPVRAVLLHEAAEQRRALYRMWEVFQLFAGAALFLHLLFGTREGWLPVVLAGGMLAVVAAVYLAVTPELIGYGRGADFLAPEQSSPDRAKAAAFERVYQVSQFVKLALGGLLLAYLLYRKTPRRRPIRAEVDRVDHPDHSHIDR